MSDADAVRTQQEWNLLATAGQTWMTCDVWPINAPARRFRAVIADRPPADARAPNSRSPFASVFAPTEMQAKRAALDLWADYSTPF